MDLLFFDFHLIEILTLLRARFHFWVVIYRLRHNLFIHSVNVLNIDVNFVIILIVSVSVRDSNYIKLNQWTFYLWLPFFTFVNRTLNSSNSLGICSPKALHDDSHFHLSNSQTCLYSYEKLVFERNLKDSKGLNDDSPYGKILRSFSLREREKIQVRSRLLLFLLR